MLKENYQSMNLISCHLNIFSNVYVNIITILFITNYGGYIRQDEAYTQIGLYSINKGTNLVGSHTYVVEN